MAIISVRPYLWPTPWLAYNAGVSSSTIALDAAGEQAAIVIPAPATGTIRKVYAAIHSVVSSGDQKMTVQTVNTSGAPSGTLVDASATKTLTVSAAGATEFDFGVGNGAPVTQGDDIAVMIENVSGSITILRPDDVNANAAYPFGYTFLNSVAARTIWPHLWIEYSDGSIYDTQNIPAGYGTNSAIVASLWDNADNPRRRGLRFKCNAPIRVRGWWVGMAAEAATTVKTELWESTGATVLTSKTWDTDRLRLNSTSTYQLIFDYFPASQTLTKDTFYRLVFEPQSGTLQCAFQFLDFANANNMDAMPSGQNMHYTNSNANPPTQESDWSQTTTRYPVMGVIIDGIDDGTGGGGPIARQSINQSIGTY